MRSSLSASSVSLYIGLVHMPSPIDMDLYVFYRPSIVLVQAWEQDRLTVLLQAATCPSLSRMLRGLIFKSTRIRFFGHHQRLDDAEQRRKSCKGQNDCSVPEQARRSLGLLAK